MDKRTDERVMDGRMEGRQRDQLEDYCNNLARDNGILAQDCSSEVGGEWAYQRDILDVESIGLGGW